MIVSLLALLGDCPEVFPVCSVTPTFLDALTSSPSPTTGTFLPGWQQFGAPWRPRQQAQRLWLVLGDQLNPEHPLYTQLNPAHDVVVMAEVAEESTKVWSHRQRIALFLAAMRHFAQATTQQLPSATLFYHALGDTPTQEPHTTFTEAFAAALTHLTPQEVCVVLPGEHSVLTALQTLCQHHNIPLTVLPDDHFLITPEWFQAHARGRKSLRMEYFYREMRQLTSCLLTPTGEPEGGAWNFDADNREPLSPTEPLPPPLALTPDALTQDVLALVARRFPTHPGRLDTFAWPVTPQHAQALLDHFIQHGLAKFGPYQDAMRWGDEPFLFHSRLSCALNLKLIHPRQVIQAAESAYRDGRAPLNSVEGFIRQILGWREYVRGLYWLKMPGYEHHNFFNATTPLPEFFWTGDTEYACLRHALGQTLDHAYAHHIQRLMVLGLFLLLLGVIPHQVHQWFLAVFVDAVEWAELPNVIGMGQFADGGLMASKPYVATGKYIARMSNYCAHCPKNPEQATGPDACPFTTLYWDFLHRHRDLLAKNPRMSLQVKNLNRLTPERLTAITTAAAQLRESLNPPSSR